MDLNLMDKLRILKIDTELRPQIKMKPLSRFYFIIPTNSGEQFFMFASTAAWLIRKLGKTFDQPSEEDDPNVTVTTIFDVLKEIGVNIDFSAHKVKQGHGDQVTFILNSLSDAVLKSSDHVWLKPEPVTSDIAEEETGNDADQIDDETDLVQERVDEQVMESSDSGSDVGFLEDGDMIRGNTAPVQQDLSQRRIHMDLESWKLEAERVASSLRVVLPADHADWRARKESMKQLRDDFKERFKTASSNLTKIHDQIGSVMSRVEGRETILNDQLKGLVKEYGLLSDKLQDVNKQCKSVSGGIIERQEVLNEINTKIENIKQKTETRGTSINDSSPLVNAKKAVQTLTKDINDLDYSICILLWILTNSFDTGYNNYIGL